MPDEQKEGRSAPEDQRPENEAPKNTGESAGAAVMPRPTFSTFILSLASSALVHLGEVPDPATNAPAENSALAKHSIDILTMLQEKISNGLEPDESRLLEGVLYELRMKYVVKK